MIELRVLGALDLRTAEGVEIRSVLAQPKRVALLAYLALQGRRRYLRRDTLLALFWPESDTEHARTSLRKGLHFLRRSLGEGIILTRGDEEVGIDPTRLRCDAGEFLRALEEGARVEALSLYRGDLLEGFYLSGAPEWEQWLEEMRGTLRQRAEEAAWRLAAEAEASGEGERAAELARRAVALARNEEPAVRKLIALLGRLGDRDGALRTYREFAERLQREFEAVPSEEIEALVEALRAVSPPPEPAPPEGTGAERPTAGSTDLLTEGEPRREIAPAAFQPQPGPDPRPRWRPAAGTLLSHSSRLLLLLLLLGVLGGGLMLARLRPIPAMPASTDLIAVLPFSYHGSGEYEYLGEGIIRLLSTNLDGAGEIQSVDPRALLSVVEQMDVNPRDPESGRVLAGQFRAGTFVLGHIIEAGGRLRITAVVYERDRRGRPLAEVSVEGDGSQLFALIDELTVKLLAARSVEPRTRFVRLAALTTHSLPALKAYLDGEREYRAGRYPAAIEGFRRAIEADTTFALAYYRMSTAAIWVGDTAADEVGRLGALRFRGNLAPRDRWLAEAWDRLSLEPRGHAASLYEAVLARHPDDVEAWFQLAEARFHWNPMLGRSVLESREAFERVLSYEPNNAPSLIHLARLAALERRGTELDSLLDRINRLEPAWDQALELAALRAFVRHDSLAQARVREQLRSGGDDLWLRTSNTVAIYANDLEGAVTLARPLTAPDRDPALRAEGHLALAQLELGRGRWSAAREELAALGRVSPLLAIRYRAAYGVFPLLRLPRPELEAIRSEVARSPISYGDPMVDAAWTGPAAIYGPGQRYLLGLLSVRLGEPLAALGYATELDQLRDTADAPFGRALARILRAQVAWTGGQAKDALDLLGEPRIPQDFTTPTFWRFTNADERFLRAELLQALGRNEEALRWYASFPDPQGYDLHYLAPSHLRRAEIHERRGEKEQAAAHYGRFVELWRDTDPELQPLVRQARRRLEGLGRSS